MTSYMDRKVSAICVPHDQALAIGEVEERSIREWHEICDIKWLRIVNAHSELNLSMVVDDDGYSRRLPWNPRAQFLSGYPLTDPIVGSVYFASLDFTGDGYDLVSLNPESAEWIKAPERWAEYQEWLRAPHNIEAVQYFMSRL